MSTPEAYQRILKPYGHLWIVNVASKSAANRAVEGLTTMIRPEQLAEATFKAPSTIILRFLDGYKFSLAIPRLGMPVDRIDWPSLKVSPGGNVVIVNGIKGDQVPIDSATLRCLVDSKYAATIDRAIRALHIPPAEFDEAAKLLQNPAWNDVPDEDDLI